MLDANANRAREALRVMEDCARFALGDEALTRELKDIRHGVRKAVEALAPFGADGASLLASRDTPGDVGTSIATVAEGDREGLRGVATAAGKRAGEALRVIEECAKALMGAGEHEARRAGRSVPADVEALRYRLYEAERRLGLAMGGARAPQWSVCVILTEALCARPWREVAAEAIASGADCVQLREKALEGGELLARARAMVALARGSGARKGPPVARPAVIINDRPDIALLSGADGVHLGQSDVRVRDARALGGERLLVGVSASSIEEAQRALRDGADYCGVGAMFPTETKRKDAIAGVGLMRAYAEHAPPLPPHLAIGGIASSNVAEVIAAGARGVAVCSAVCGAARPGDVVRGLLMAVSRV